MKIISWVLHKSWLVAAVIIVLLALCLGMARLSTPLLSRYQQPIAEWLSHELRVPVTIGKIEASWYGLQPSVKVEQLVIHDRISQKPVFSIDAAYFGISLSHSILHRQLVLGQFLIDGAKITVKHVDNHWYVSGLSEEAIIDDGLRVTVRQVIGWFFAQRRLELKNVDINLMMPSNQTVSLKQFNAVFLQKENQKYRIRGSVNLGEKTPGQLEFALNSSGETDKPEKIRARFFVGAKYVELEPWVDYINQYGFSLASGQLKNVKIQGRYKDNQIYQLQSQYDLSNVAGVEQQAPVINRLTGNLAYQISNNKDWDLAIDMADIKVNKKSWPKNWMSIRKTHDHQSERAHYSFYLNYAKFSPMLAILKNIQHHDPQLLLNKIEHLSGTAKEIYIVASDDFSDTGLFSLGADFEDISWKISGWPEMSNLNGHIAADQNSGELMLLGKDSRIYYPEIFSDSLDMKRVETSVVWFHDEDGWRFKVPNLYLEDDVSKFSGSLHVDIPGLGTPSIELLGGVQANAFTSADVTKHLPEKIMSPKVVEWLSQAILDGKSLNSTVVLRGKLSDFPFQDSAGTFIVQSQFDDLNLAYLPSWPQGKNLSGYLRFEEAGMEALVHSGQLSGTNIVKAKVVIPDFKAAPATLHISGYAKGTMSQGLQYIAASPLDKSIGKMLQPIQPEGDLDLKLELQFPLQQNLSAEEITINGMINLQDNELKLKKWQDLTLNKLQGRVLFDRTSASANGVAGVLWGNPLYLNMETKSKQLQINASSDLTAASINKFLGLPEEKWLAGNAGIFAQLNLNENKKNSLHIVSDLKGFSSQLPHPFNKSVEEEWASKLSMHFDEKNIDADLKIGQNISSRINVPVADGVAGVHGQIGIGKVAVSDKRPGIWLVGKLDHWYWQQWQPLLAELDWNAFKSESSTNKSMFGIDVFVNDLELFGLGLPTTQINAKPIENLWQFNFNGEKITGKVKLPSDLQQGVINVDLSRLIMQPKENLKTTVKLQPRDLPNIQMKVNDTWLKDMPLGRFNLQVSRQPQGAVIDRLEFATPWLHFVSHGLWHLDKGKSVTEFSGQLTSTNLSRMLSHWHLPPHLHGNKAKFSFNLNWPGTPADISLKTVEGLVKAHVKSGYFSGLSKEAGKKIGLGNLVGMLSLHSITKRLQLDFKDITHKGYHFDVLKGNFKLHQGNATARKLRMMGTVADITIKGSIGLLSEIYDLRVIVVPHLTGSLPVIATLAGGPIAGAVTWLIDKAVGKEVDQMTRYEYLVTGSWQNPIIQPIRAPMRRVAKKKHNNIMLSHKANNG